MEVDHFHDEISDDITHTALFQLLSRIQFTTPVLLQPRQVEERLVAFHSVHQDLSNHTSHTEDIHLRVQHVILLHTLTQRAPPLRRKITPVIIAEFAKVLVVVF